MSEWKPPEEANHDKWLLIDVLLLRGNLVLKNKKSVIISQYILAQQWLQHYVNTFALCLSLKKKMLKHTMLLKIPSVQVLKVFFFPSRICETRGLRLHFCLIGAYSNTPGIPYVHFAI